MTESAWLQVELGSKSLANTIDRAVALASGQDASVLMLNAAVELSASLQKIAHVNRFMVRALVNDRSFVNGMRKRNSGVDAVLVVNFLFNNGLSDMVNVVVGDLVDLFAQIDNGALLWQMLLFVAVLFAERVEELDIFFGVGVLFVNVGHWDLVVMVDFILDLSVHNGLNMMLQMMNMSVVFTLSLHLFDFLVTVSSMGDGLEMLVIVLSVFAGRVELVVSSVVVTERVAVG